jgi:hypothetical protein
MCANLIVPTLLLLQLKHEQDSLAGITHQPADQQTSLANPLHIKQRDGAAAAADAAAEDAGSLGNKQQNCCCSSSPKPLQPCVYSAHDLTSHLDIGSMQPRADSTEGSSDQPLSLVEKAVAEHLQQLQYLEQLEDQLYKEYPHGIPVRKT